MNKIVIQPTNTAEAAQIHVPEHATPTPVDKLTRELPAADKSAEPAYLPQYITPEQYHGKLDPERINDMKRSRTAVVVIAAFIGAVGLYNLVVSSYWMLASPGTATALLLYAVPVQLAMVVIAYGLVRQAPLALKLSKPVLVLVILSSFMSQSMSHVALIKIGSIAMIIVAALALYVLADTSVKRLFGS